MGTVKKLVLVEWVDSASNSGWHKFGETDRVSNCVSVGILWYEDEKQIVLASSRSDFGNIADTNAIPKVAVKRIRELRVKKWL